VQQSASPIRYGLELLEDLEVAYNSDEWEMRLLFETGNESLPLLCGQRQQMLCIYDHTPERIDLRAEVDGHGGGGFDVATSEIT
jgi:hypothetical protein